MRWKTKMADTLIKYILPSKNICKIVNLKVKPKCQVSKGSIVATYVLQDKNQDTSNDKELLKFKSEYFGTVEELLVKDGDVIKPGTAIMTVSSCSHPTVMKDMCAECGADLREPEGLPGQRRQLTTASVAMVHSIPELHVSKKEAYHLAQLDEQRLLKNHKLVLVVDLDQTIIHTTMDNVPADLPGVFHFQLWGVGANGPWYHTKMRPGYQAFLEKVSSLYELHIFTMGARLYAHTIASFLDPGKKYFSHRILSRDECFDQNLKTANLRSIFPCGDNMVAIIDDRDDVWNYAPNLIMVPPYKYFEGTGDINAPPGLKETNVETEVQESEEKEVDDSAKESEIEEMADAKDNTEDAGSQTKVDVTTSVASATPQEVLGKTKQTSSKDTIEEPMDVEEGNGDKTHENGDQIVKKQEKKGDEESDNDDYFLYLEDILERVHKEFYDAYDHLQKQPDNKKHKPSIPDLKIILPTLKRKVLAGVNIVFSGVFPTNMNPEQSRAWKVATALGAHINTNVMCKAKGSTAVINATTHVVAAKLGTSKIHTAQRAKNIHIVTTEWLWCCWERWQHVDERLFKLLPGSSGAESKSASRASTPSSDASETIHRSTFKRQKGKHSSKSKSTPTKRIKLSSPEVDAKVKTSGDAAVRSRHLSLSAEYNPVYSFSTEELASMDEEVEGIFDESSSSSSSSSGKSDVAAQVVARSNKEGLGSITQPISSSSDESLTAENPKGWVAKKKKIRDRDSESEHGSDSSSSAGLSDSDQASSDEDRMAAEIDDLLTYSKGAS